MFLFTKQNYYVLNAMYCMLGPQRPGSGGANHLAPILPASKLSRSILTKKNRLTVCRILFLQRKPILGRTKTSTGLHTRTVARKFSIGGFAVLRGAFRLCGGAWHYKINQNSTYL